MEQKWLQQLIPLISTATEQAQPRLLRTSPSNSKPSLLRWTSRRKLCLASSRGLWPRTIRLCKWRVPRQSRAWLPGAWSTAPCLRVLASLPCWIRPFRLPRLTHPFLATAQSRTSTTKTRLVWPICKAPMRLVCKETSKHLRLTRPKPLKTSKLLSPNWTAHSKLPWQTKASRLNRLCKKRNRISILPKTHSTANSRSHCKQVSRYSPLVKMPWTALNKPTWLKLNKHSRPANRCLTALNRSCWRTKPLLPTRLCKKHSKNSRLEKMF